MDIRMQRIIDGFEINNPMIKTVNSNIGIINKDIYQLFS